MSKKDFELIAKTISELGPCSYRLKVAVAFAAVLTTTNPRFNEHRFLKACEPK